MQVDVERIVEASTRHLDIALSQRQLGMFRHLVTLMRELHVDPLDVCVQMDSGHMGHKLDATNLGMPLWCRFKKNSLH